MNGVKLDGMTEEKIESELGILNRGHKLKIMAELESLRQLKKYSKLVDSGVLDKEIKEAKSELNQINEKIIKLK